MNLTREEAIQWCIDNEADFTKPEPVTPPTGWLWILSESVTPSVKWSWVVSYNIYCLTPRILFNHAHDGDIEETDVVLKMAAIAQKNYRDSK